LARKTYIQKLNDTKELPKVVKLNEKERKRLGGKTMAIAKPTDIYAIMKKVPKKRVITLSEIRKIVSEKYDADICCPLTTGIFVNISAHASLELKDDLPYWRTLKSGGELNPKFPNAPDEQIALLQSEGFTIVKKGRKNIRYFVKDYDKYLVSDI